MANPFEQPASGGGGNPFDPFAGGQAYPGGSPPPAQQPAGVASPPQHQQATSPMSGPYPPSPANAFGQPQATASPQQQQQQGNPFGQQAVMAQQPQPHRPHANTVSPSQPFAQQSMMQQQVSTLQKTQPGGYDPFGGNQVPPHQTPPVPPRQSMASPQQSTASFDPLAAVPAPSPANVTPNAFGAPYTQQQQSQQPPHTAMSPMPPQQPAVQRQSTGSFATTAPGALVVSQQQSNPYAGVAAPTPAPQPAQALVPAVNPNANQWGAPPAQPNPVHTAINDPWGTAQLPPATPPPKQAPVPARAPSPATKSPPKADVPDRPRYQPDEPKSPPATTPLDTPYSDQIDQSQPQSNAVVSATENRLTVGQEARNKYSQELARMAHPGASALPKAELVRKTGYILSRISFRTIVMKKWKQSFWVQYGSHTMLWFRSQGDFDDWLNNPYHNQSQRNFLIKLAVNFVHDLYKPNVRGYQVTQSRSKPYRNKMVRQFKLERWMDYGPTIAAAFGSYDAKEVDTLREAIVDCMRNTPLEGGVRATGAVRENNPHIQNNGYGTGGRDDRPTYNNYSLPQGYSSRQQSENGGENGNTTPGSGERPPSKSDGNQGGNREPAGSVSSVQDLLDFGNSVGAGKFDDSASYPGQGGSGAAQNFSDTMSLPGAMVPVYNPAPQAYHGAPPTPAQGAYVQPNPYQQTHPQQAYPSQNGYGQSNPYNTQQQQQQQTPQYPQQGLSGYGVQQTF